MLFDAVDAGFVMHLCANIRLDVNIRWITNKVPISIGLRSTLFW